MSWLAPWFLAGLVALAAPLVLHFIRRTPQGHQVFSTLMFLRPNPPQVHRRSRLQHLLLLLLRLTAFTMLVLAFSRPFWRTEIPLGAVNAPRRHVAILLDTSASMQRAGMWQLAMETTRQRLTQLATGDQVALFTFDEGLRAIVDFPPADQTGDVADGRVAVERALLGIQPSWYATNLATAVTDVAQQLEVRADQAIGELWVISDFQEGAQWDDLRQFAWPENVKCEALTIQPTQPWQAMVRVLESNDPSATDQAAVRVNVTGKPTSAVVHLAWRGAEGQVGKPETVSIGRGESRVVTIARPSEALALEVLGDDDPFGNTFHVTQIHPRSIRIGYVARQLEENPRGMLYFFRRAVADLKGLNCEVTPLAPTAVEQHLEGDNAAPTDLLVVTTALDAAAVEAVDRSRKRGMDVMLVVSDDAGPNAASGGPPDWDAPSLERWQIRLLASATPTQARVPSVHRDDLLPEHQILETINYRHPLFSRFAEPRFADFTKIRFWNHTGLEPPAGADVLASFEDREPFLWEESGTGGRRWVLTSGWHPKASQFGVSSKFVPWVAAILDQAVGPSRLTRSYAVGEVLDPKALGFPIDQPFTISGPDGSWSGLGTAIPADILKSPGLYTMTTADHELQLAVNLAGSEGKLDVADVTQWLPADSASGGEHAQRKTAGLPRVLAVELEARQRFWQWLLLAAGVLLACETWLAGVYDGRLTRELAVATEME